MAASARSDSAGSAAAAAASSATTGPGAVYAFGDTPTARRRLDVLGEVFRPTTEALLGGLTHDGPRLALDLGCGPGHTTALLAARFPAATVVGLDASAAFLAHATPTDPTTLTGPTDLTGPNGETTPTGAATLAGPATDAVPTGPIAPAAGTISRGAGTVRFRRHDVTRTPFPDAPADVVYARFLLAHLPEPERLVAAWAAQLAPGGFLVLEETEWIRTEDPDFTHYLGLIAGRLLARGTRLYVGRLLAGLLPPAGVSVTHRGVAVLDPTTGQAATMFALNMVTLRRDELVRIRHRPHDLDTLTEALTRRTADEHRGQITWGVRQIVFHRPR